MSDSTTKVVYHSMHTDTYHISHGGFIDPREQAIIKLAWSKDGGPRWMIAAAGLNLGGTCTNPSCEAYDKRVIHMWGKRNFDFFAQEHLCTCPICGGYVQPITCGFTDTYWKMSGYKKARAGSPPERVPGQWYFASSDGYTTFNESLTQVIQWKELKIEVDSWGPFWNIFVFILIFIFLLTKGMGITRFFRKRKDLKHDIVLDTKKGLFTNDYLTKIEQEIKKGENVHGRNISFLNPNLGLGVAE